MREILDFFKKYPKLIYVGILSIVSFFLLQYKRKADTIERTLEIKDKEKEIAVKEERLKHEETNAKKAVDSYRDAKSKYDKLRSDG